MTARRRVADFEQRVAAYIGSEGLLAPGARVIVGLSGGADSTALLGVLGRLGYECIAVHCNFGLRGEESEADMRHSRALAARFNARFVCVRFNVEAYMREHGCSTEMACRDLRYDFFESRLREFNAEAIAVGHHMEDNVETFFLNLFRGTGIRGLRAMLPRRGHVVRPLLAESREEIEHYVGALGVDYVTDSTNAHNVFKRNRIRNVILPLLEEQFPGAVDAVNRTIGNLRADERIIDSAILADDTPLELTSPAVLRYRLSAMGFNASQCADIVRSAPGATFLSPSHRLSVLPGRRYEITGVDATLDRPRLSGRVYPKPERFRPEPGVLYMDAEAMTDAAWQLRPWQPGDRIRPFGMRGSKPVSDLLAADGVAASSRRQRYVLTRNSDIVWVVGVRASAHFPITENTKQIIEIRHEKD